MPLPRLRFVSLFVALVAVCIAAPAAASARVPNDFVGIVSEDVFAGDASYRTAQLNAQRSIGVGLIRQTFRWSEIEAAPGRYDLSQYDQYVAHAAAHGMRILPILYDSPAFRSRAPGAARSGAYPPRNLAALGRFGAVLARRYGPGGSLWRERQDIPYLPIRAWQIWNEPNLRAYWPKRPNARQYARMLVAASRQIKRVDRRAEIVTGGMPESRYGVPLMKYLTQLYRAGAARGFDTMAINPYARDHRELVATLKKVRRLMNRFGDRRAPIWITELGWSDDGPRRPLRAGPRGQAVRITRSYSAASKLRRKLRLRGIVYYSWRDARPYPPDFRDLWGLHTGLLTLEGQPKPAFHAFQSAIARLR